MGRTVKGIHLDSHRGYRERCVPRDGEHGFQLMIGEADLCATAMSSLSEGFKDTLVACVCTPRGELEVRIVLHPEFRHSFMPVPLSCSALPPEIARRTTKAPAIAGARSFTTVTGTIAQMVAGSLVGRFPDLIIENGGDILMHLRRDHVVGPLSDPESGVFIGLNVVAPVCPLVLYAPSAIIGHSPSFGQGELVFVRSLDGALTDALATASCNRPQGPGDAKAVVGYAWRFVKHGFIGILAQCGGVIGVWGDIELTAVEQDFRRAGEASGVGGRF